MDLNEILAFNPEKPSLKRLADGEPVDSDMRPPHAKQTRGGGRRGGGGVAGASVSDEEKLRILQSVDEDEEEEEGEGLDVGGVKRMLLSFEKKVRSNVHPPPGLSVCVCVCVCVQYVARLKGALVKRD